MKTAAVALTFGHWPLGRPLLELDHDDWLIAVAVLELAQKYRRDYDASLADHTGAATISHLARSMKRR